LTGFAQDSKRRYGECTAGATAKRDPDERYKKTILAIVLSAIVLIVWQYFFAIPQEKARQGKLAAQQQIAQNKIRRQPTAAANQLRRRARPACPRFRRRARRHRTGDSRHPRRSTFGLRPRADRDR